MNKYFQVSDKRKTLDNRRIFGKRDEPNQCSFSESNLQETQDVCEKDRVCEFFDISQK